MLLPSLLTCTASLSRSNAYWLPGQVRDGRSGLDGCVDVGVGGDVLAGDVRLVRAQVVEALGDEVVIWIPLARLLPERERARGVALLFGQLGAGAIGGGEIGRLAQEPATSVASAAAGSSALFCVCASSSWLATLNGSNSRTRCKYESARLQSPPSSASRRSLFSTSTSPGSSFSASW